MAKKYFWKTLLVLLISIVWTKGVGPPKEEVVVHLICHSHDVK